MSRYRLRVWCLVTMAGGFLVYSVTSASSLGPMLTAEQAEKAPIETLMQQWEKDVRLRMEKDEKLKALAGRFPLVLLHSRRYAKGGYSKSAYSFIHETNEDDKHKGNCQILFDNGGEPNTVDFNMDSAQQNLAVDLGDADFSKDIDPAKISIAHSGVLTGVGRVIEGHLYLERVRDVRGSNFYVLFKVVTVDKEGRYMAFLWRKLPGGKVVKD